MEEYRDDKKSKLYYMDEILHKISSMSQAENEKQLDDITPSILKSVGKYTAADRAYIFEWSSEKKESFKNTFEWCASGIEPQIQNLQKVPVCLMQNWVETFIQKKNIIIYDLEEIAEETPQEYEILKPQNIHALIAVPIYTNHKFIGFIGLDNPDLNQNMVSMNLLSDVGCHMGSVRENLRMMKALEDALETANLNGEIIDSISKLYWLIYRMNLETGTYEEISAGNEMHKLTGKHGKTEEAFQHAINTIVDGEHQEMMKKFLDTSTLADRLKDTESIAVEYRAQSGSWHLARFIVKKRNPSGKVTNVLYVVQQIDKEKQVEITYKQELIKKNRILSGLSRDYTTAFVLNLDTDEYEFVFNQETNHAQKHEEFKAFSDYVDAYASAFALPEFRDVMRRELDSNVIKKHFETEDEYHFSFETSPNAAGLSCFQAHIVKEYEEGSHFAFLGFRSIDEIVQKERFYKDSLQKANQSKSDFLSRMSHDMRTPLNGIIGLMDICMKHPEDRTLVDSSRLKARVAADHLLSLINDTLELSKLENEEVKLAKEDFYLSELLCEVETIAQMRADEECITIHFMYDPYSIPYPNLIGSSLHVKQIFLNLITNSIKYNRRNGSVDCYLKEEKESDERVLVDVTIKDTGIGMSEDFLKNIFQPFVQADQGARSQYKGTGLGMAIVKELIDRMGGTIQIDSVENQGTTIRVVIPFEIAEEPAAVQEMSELPKENLSGCRILLAEDNELNREIAVFLLKDEGISVTEAEDGQQALECFLKMPEGYYDAVLMDIMMPTMDGYQAARAIRGSGKKDAETIPIIAMTANAFAEDKRKTMEAGMDAHLSKPLNVPELMETIRKFCVGKQMCQ